MKHTYKKRYLDFLLVVICLFFLLDSASTFIQHADHFAIYLLRLIWLAVALLSLISLVAPKMNGEQYSRYFIVVSLIMPPVLVLAQCLTDLIFYGAFRTDLLLNPLVYVKLILGITLLVLAIRLSKESELERVKEFGLLSIIAGSVVVLRATLRMIDTDTGASFSIINTVIGVVIGLTLMFLGSRLKNKKIRLKTFLIVLVVLILIGRI
jgi:hypothetical protein